MIPNEERLFVYGTLMQGGSNHILLAGAELVGRDVTTEGFSMLDLGAYPGLVRPGPDQIAGELYRIPATLLPILDQFEGVPGLYLREKVPLASGHSAWCYLFCEADSAAQRIAGGHWSV